MLLLDHRDSFVHNIEQLIMQEGFNVVTLRPNEVELSGIERMRPSSIILSPGPGNPFTQKEKFEKSIEVVKKFGKNTPILGICLGMQIINVALGGTLRKAKRVYHGIVDDILVTDPGPLYFDVPERFKATRYHSLVIDKLADGLVVEALSLSDGEIMSVRHKEYKIYGTQYHPESVGTLPLGQKIVRNFLLLTKRLGRF